MFKDFEKYSLADPPRFGINITFERDIQEIYGILINYNLMCALLVLVSSVNFLIDPKDSNRAAILVALLLVLATVFNATKVSKLNSQLISFVQNL